MNIRFTTAYETLPARIRSVPRFWRSLSARTRIVMGALGLAAVALLLWHFLSGSKTREAPPAAVVVATATSRTVTAVEHTMGTVIANATVQVTARVSGQLLSAGFKEGQIVRAGDLLFQIDPKPYQAALEQARAQLAKDTAQLLSARNDKARYDALFAQGAASSQLRDQADATAKGMVATVDSDRAALDVARLNLGYTRIVSPINGKTGPILIQPGNLIAAGATSPLVVVTQIQPVKISFALPQSDLPQIQQRAHAHTLVATLDQRETGGGQLSAPVDFVSNQVSDQTGTIELRATFGNLDARLVPGQLIDISVSLNSFKNATVVPREAVNDGPNGRYAFVVSADSVAAMRPVKVLFDDGTNMAVTGIKPGEKVIIDGQLLVEPGVKVAVARTHAAGKRAEPNP